MKDFTAPDTSLKSPDCIILSVPLYGMFIAHGKEGIDAMNVYIHLYYTAKKQHTNQVWAAARYLKKGLTMGHDRIKKAKSFLHKKGLISYIQKQDPETGKLEKTYIKINYIYTQETAEKITAGLKITPLDNGLNDDNRRFENNTHGSYIRSTGDKTEMLKVNNLNTLNKKRYSAYSEIIEYLNQVTGSAYRSTSKTARKHISARFNEGFLLDDFKTVINVKSAEWSGTEMSKYLRPETLFGNKFESYLNQQKKSHVKTAHTELETCPECGSEMHPDGFCFNCDYRRERA